MSEAKRQKNKLHSVINEHLIPEQAVAGDVYFARAEGTVWLTTKSGVVVCLSDILHGECVHTPPRAGRDGIDGASIKGDRGARGADGADGKDGRDGVGRPGVNGNHGSNGRDGKDGAPGPDSAAVLASTNAALADVLAKFADLKLVVNAIHGQNKQCDEYIQFLRNKRKAKQ